MYDFPVDLLVKQSLRSVVFDPASMGILSAKLQNLHLKTNTPVSGALNPDTAFYSLLKNPDTVQHIFEKPRDNMHKIFECGGYKEILRTAKNENEVKDMKHQILYNFVKELNEFRPPYAFEWAALQHYMHFVYRNFLSPDPVPCNEPVPTVLTKRMYEHVQSLAHEDKTQFFVRVVTLLREYAMTACDHFDNLTGKGDAAQFLQSLLNYYGVFCSAAMKITSVFSNFDTFMNEHFGISWYRLHQKLFLQFFFSSACVQGKLPMFKQLTEANAPTNRDLIVGYRNFANDMALVDKLWDAQQKKFDTNGLVSLEDSRWQKDWQILDELTKIMKTNFWIEREFKSQVCPELEDHFLSMVEDTWHMANRLLTPEGCICEDCLFVKFRYNVIQGFNEIASSNERLMMCYVCHETVNVDMLAGHLVQELGEQNISRSDGHKTFKWQSNGASIKKILSKKPSSKLYKILSDTVVKSKDPNLFKMNDECFNKKGDANLLKEPLTKRLLESPLRDSESIVRLANDYGKTPNDPPTAKTKLEKEPSIKIASEPPVFKVNTNFTSGAESRNGENKPAKPNSDKKKDDTTKDGYTLKFNVNNLPRNQGKLSDPKIVNFLGTGNQAKGNSANTNASKAGDNCMGHACGHKCKKEEGQNGHADSSSDNGKDKKCDCAYCEVFGTNVPSHTHKTSETRDRLRNRLTRRKERINEILKTKTGLLTPPQSSSLRGRVEATTKAALNGHAKAEAPPQAAAIVKAPPAVPKIVETPKVVEKPKVEVPEPDKCDYDVDRLVDFIQGKPVDKVALAEKKAAKKARQRQKKEEERLKKEEEEEKQRQAELRKIEEKRRVEDRLKAQALKQSMAQSKKNKKNKKGQQQQQQQVEELKKNTSSKQKGPPSKSSSVTELMEETIPAMVTIKRVVENNNSLPTVTITLKGSTPDQDKLLYTLVNGHASDYESSENEQTVTNNGNKKQKKGKQQQEQQQKKNDTAPLASQSKKSKKKNGKENNSNGNETIKTNGRKASVENGNNGGVISTKQMKVTLTVDKSFHKGKEIVETAKKNHKQQSNGVVKEKEIKRVEHRPTQRSTDFDFDIPSLKLPPGITITKVSGPLANRNTNGSISSSSQSTGVSNGTGSFKNVPVNKSGVIVVDTEKLIQQQAVSAPTGKKNKKKKKKAAQQAAEQERQAAANKQNCDTKPAMVTLRNPIFQAMQSKSTEKPDLPILSCNEQASITKGENGMVTIRRPSCMHPMDASETPISEYLGKLKPVIGYDAPKKEKEQKSFQTNGTIDHKVRMNYRNDTASEDLYRGSIDRSRMSTHDILWGLPGIEITKVNKNSIPSESESRKASQTADVSIIPTSSLNNGEKFHFDKDDWPFESVFAPKDILEDDLDADERELEAFKRFCQQSIPPKHKEKVAHLNVKDIVLKKKNDLTYS